VKVNLYREGGGAGRLCPSTDTLPSSINTTVVSNDVCERILFSSRTYLDLQGKFIELGD
jgi:hypothetical protein